MCLFCLWPCAMKGTVQPLRQFFCVCHISGKCFCLHKVWRRNACWGGGGCKVYHLHTEQERDGQRKRVAWLKYRFFVFTRRWKGKICMCWTNTYPSAGGGVMQSGTVARASLTGEKKLENLVEKEILMENPWKKKRQRRRRKTNAEHF